MKDYLNFLKTKYKLTEKKAHFYGLSVKKFIESTPTTSTKEIQKEEIDNYINNIKNTHEEWQIVQANEALQLYLYHQTIQQDKSQLIHRSSNEQQWKDVAQNMVNMIRLRHLPIDGVGICSGTMV